MQNKSYAYLLNVKASNLIFLKTPTTFTDQNGRPWETEYNINLTLLINK